MVGRGREVYSRGERGREGEGEPVREGRAISRGREGGREGG